MHASMVTITEIQGAAQEKKSMVVRVWQLPLSRLKIILRL